LTPDKALALLHEDTRNLNHPWATAIVVANQRIAHSTVDGVDVIISLGIAFDTVPKLMQRAFLDHVEAS
jgi:hypothetical protein